MPSKTLRTVLHLVLAASLLLGASAHAGGLYLYEIGGPEVGLAAAGYAARAQDATTVFTNPAGMTRLARPEVHLGLQPMYLHLPFDASASNTTSGGDGDSNEWIPSGSAFYVQPIGEKLRVGFGVAGYFGLSLDYGDDWVGRYFANEVTLQGLSLLPTVAYRVNDWLSLGAGLTAMYGTLEYKIAVNNSGPRDDRDDGKLKLEDTDWGFGGNFGVLVEPSSKTRFGVTYLTKTELDFKDSPKFSGITNPLLQPVAARAGGANLDLGVTAPQAVMVSAYHQVTERLALMGNLGWQDWSAFGAVEVTVSSENVDEAITTDLDYKDTWHAALGAQYRVSDPWLLSCGAAYDSSMLDDDQRSPALPVGEQWRLGLGAQYAWSRDLTLGGAYEVAWGGDLDLDVERGRAGRVSGRYNDAALHAFNVSLDWKF